MAVNPPRNAPPASPAVARALDAVAPRDRGTFRRPDDPRVQGAEAPPPVDANAIRARAERWQRDHQRPANTNAPDPGEVLARAPRPDGTELRVSLHHYQGKPFLRIAPWQRGEGDTWWPVKGKGCTVKVRELGAVALALAAAMDRCEGAA